MDAACDCGSRNLFQYISSTSYRADVAFLYVVSGHWLRDRLVACLDGTVAGGCVDWQSDV
ncbi:hypothetical protein D3C76_1776550 [compost metagenome]